MNCPKCRIEIDDITIEGVELNFCSACKGIWFDKDELAFMEEIPVDVPDTAEITKEARRTEHDCPRCGDQKLEEMKFIKTEDLLIDRCPKCRGVWLDKGELRKIEHIAAHIETPNSKIMLACKQLQEKGYEILGVKYTS